ncbi:MAG TPA: hypothetical protein VK403_10530 [Allosphingosinicella sp.]|nr:hypothetical protein [Allosphingosinicella sp.]
MGIRKRVTMFAAVVAATTLTYATPAAAQATRTWVSGTGDDINPCSRTAPCKTFAGAINKTAAGGEINCLDPGGFGAVTINKSMTIDCQYTEGGALAGGNGIVVNDGATATPGTAVVLIRGLDIFGVSPPSNGVRFVSGASLTIDDCIIRRFNATGSFGVSFQPSGAAKLFIIDSIIAHNGNAADNTGGGILVQPTGGAGSARVQLSHVKVLENAGVGVRVDTTGNTSATGTFVTARWSAFSGSPTGFTANMPVGNSGVGALIADSIINHNSGVGVSATGSATATIRVGGTMISDNGTGVQSSGGGSVRSYGNNMVNGNTVDGTFIAGAAVLI